MKHWVETNKCKEVGRCFHLVRGDRFLAVALSQESHPVVGIIDAPTAFQRAVEEEDRAETCPVFVKTEK